ncbi:MAG: hypothetical protein ACM34K_01455 [Bacillota bacterium]
MGRKIFSILSVLILVFVISQAISPPGIAKTTPNAEITFAFDQQTSADLQSAMVLQQISSEGIISQSHETINNSTNNNYVTISNQAFRCSLEGKHLKYPPYNQAKYVIGYQKRIKFLIPNSITL